MRGISVRSFRHSWILAITLLTTTFPSPMPFPGWPGGPVGLAAQTAEPPRRFSTDLRVRPALVGGRTTLDTGERTTGWDLRARTQAGITLFPDGPVAVRGRISGRLSTDQEGLSFFVRDHAPGTGGLRHGDWTVDELHLDLRPAAGLRARVGRFQTRFALPSVITRSLDRDDSPSGNVTWTDGMHLEALLVPRWRAHLIVQHQSERGPTNTIRAPLSFHDANARWSAFTAIVTEGPRGRLVHGGLDLTVLPNATPAAAEGADPAAVTPHGERGTYIGLVARSAFRLAEDLPLGASLVGGLEAGLATGTPDRSRTGVGRSGRGPSQGAGVVLSLSLLEIREAHAIGASFGSLGDGWLTSPTLLPNHREVEARYRWRMRPDATLELRVRGRKQVMPRTGRTGRQGETNAFARMTWSW